MSKPKANKVVIIGDSSVGKTCIIQRYITNTFKSTTATIGACHYNKMINDIPIDIWDTAGQERFKSMIPMYYKGAKAIIVTFDLTEINTFEGAKKWLSEIETNSKGSVIIIVGNKSDLKDKRQVTNEMVDSIVIGKKYLYIETSAKEDENINKLFELVAEEIKKNKDNETKNKNIDINNAETTSEGSTCGYCY